MPPPAGSALLLSLVITAMIALILLGLFVRPSFFNAEQDKIDGMAGATRKAAELHVDQGLLNRMLT